MNQKMEGLKKAAGRHLQLKFAFGGITFGGLKKNVKQGSLEGAWEAGDEL